ncbi:hypothetical protein U91I_04193 [alpha proteobacterium U9-1i]|nr:hypothetical protein U91I_04193 [alpha proteobacterium U9-1i]
MLHYNTCVTCDCGARYERAEVRLPIKDIGVFECHDCGKMLEHWHSQTVPHFRAAASAPERKTSAA